MNIFIEIGVIKCGDSVLVPPNTKSKLSQFDNGRKDDTGNRP